MEQAYRHLPLPSKRHIRLIAVEPGDFDDVVSIHIITLTFEDAVKAGYTALSYVWGDEAEARYVHIRNYDYDENAYVHIKSYLRGRRRRRRGKFRVTKNLEEALRYLRQDHLPTYLWIDALCINQSDNVEKSLQVRRMGSIYSLASRVLAWLGPAGGGSEEAMVWMTHFGNEIDVDWTIHLLVPRMNTTNADFGDVTKGVRLSSKLAGRVLHVISRPWFERLWIRQEVYLADQSRVQVACGHSAMAWRDFRNVLIGLSQKGVDVVVDSPGEVAAALKLEQQLGDRLHELRGLIFQEKFLIVSRLRENMDGARCKDDRDRIFALLDMLHPIYRQLELEPDYSKTVVEVYHAVCLRYLERRADANILENCWLQDGTNDMPSWVPDWRQPLITRHLLKSRASGGFGPRRHFTDSSHGGQNSVLHICGVQGPKIDVIATVGRYPAVLDWIQWTRSLKDALLPLSCLGDLDGRYPPDETLTNLEAYASVLVAWDLRLEQRPRHPSLPLLSDSVSVLRRLIDLQRVEDVDSHLSKLTEDLKNEGGHVRTFVSRAVFCLVERRLARSSTGAFMLVPGAARLGDEACALVGCDQCMLLRRSDQPRTLGQHRLVGPCFVPGLSNAEAFLGPLPAEICQAWDYKMDMWVWDIPTTTGDRISSTFDPRTELVLQRFPHDFVAGYREHMRRDPSCTLEVDIDTLQEHGRSVSPFWNAFRYFEII